MTLEFDIFPPELNDRILNCEVLGLAEIVLTLIIPDLPSDSLAWRELFSIELFGLGFKPCADPRSVVNLNYLLVFNLSFLYKLL